MEQRFNELAVAIHGLVSVFGGLAYSLSKRQYKFLEILTHMVVAGFTGTIAGMIAISLFPDRVYWTMAIAGSFGYAGKEGMDWIIRITRKSLEANIK